jgi:hypothetical protein
MDSTRSKVGPARKPESRKQGDKGMKITMGVAMGVLLTGLSLICLTTRQFAFAVPEKESAKNVIAKSARNNSRGAMPGAWRLGKPVNHENLTIFPVISDEAVSTEEFITLDEGLRLRKVKVKELGAESQEPEDGAQRTESRITRQNNRVNIRQRRGDSAEVNRLAIINNSGKTLILIAGEIVLGGKQDRIVAHDCMVASTNKPVPIDVFCVEHGRWSPRSGGDAGVGGEFYKGETVMASPKERNAAQAKKDQSEVWKKVAEKVADNKVSTSTGTLNSVYENRHVSARLRAYESMLKSKLASRQIVGAVVAVNGQIVSADVFANGSLFQAYWPKLLKSYSLEAISAPKIKHKEAQSSDAETFLSRVEGEKSQNDMKGVYSVKENQSDDDASFELEHAGEKSKLIHFNRVNKKY